MGTPNFIHLHTHSEFSLLDGACRIKDIVKQAVEFEMPSVALTDHGVMFGSLAFYDACKKSGIKPIIGCEVYVAPRHRTLREPKIDHDQFHLVLLAENEIGYKNLLKLVSIGYTEGFYYKPRVDREVLAQYSEGLIALTACIGGEVPQYYLRNNVEKAEEAFNAYLDIFGKNNVYLEIQDHGIPEQKTANEALINLAQRYKIPLVASNDIHYLKKKDAAAHDVLLCIQTGAVLDDPKRFRFHAPEFYMKSQKEMADLFGHIPGAIENTFEISQRCNLDLDFSRIQLPKVYIPEGMDDAGYMEALCWEGLEKKCPNATDEYKDRLRYEIDTIVQCGFPRYMLIVREYARFAKDSGIYMGVRGSAAASLVCYCLDITDFDPIEFTLTFERFLNVERVEMPDIDMDFQDDRREDVLKWVSEKYGSDHVAQIVTYGTLAARAAVRDVGKVLGAPSGLVDKVCKAIPTIPVGISIEKALNQVPELAELYRNPEIRNVIDTAKQLEGISRHSSVHAAGVIISHDPLTDHVPVSKGAKGELITQYDADGLKKVGLLKMDFLGLANLTILSRAIQNIKKSQNVDVDIHTIPLDDDKTYEMLGKGDTTGVFQLESPGMRRNIQELKPHSVAELAAMVALYRPGPMANIPKFINSKFGREPITYLHPSLAPILKETYGVIVYQDQVLHIVRATAGFTLGQADIFRRVMSKKKVDEMGKQKANFLAGAKEQGISQALASQIFDHIEPFAGYAFNKAHAVCYAHVAYQTAYLKAHYPVEYFAAMLATHFDNKEKVAIYIEECRRMGIQVLPPDVNESDADFTVQNGAIRFGMAAIKNCGKGVVDVIVSAREAGGPFKTLHEFCERVTEVGQVGKSAVDTLIRAGAFASISPNRNQTLAMLEDAMGRAASINKDKANGQVDLFGGMQEQSSFDVNTAKYAGIEDFTRDELLALERDLLGLYVSDHPLNHVRQELQEKTNANSEDLQELADNQECVVGGLVTDIRYHYTKKSGDKMAFIKVEDLTGPVSVTIFPKTFKEYGARIEKDQIIIVQGKASHRDRLGNGKGSSSSSGDEEKSYQVEVVADAVMPIEEAGRIRVIEEETAEVSTESEEMETYDADGSPTTDKAEVHIRLLPAFDLAYKGMLDELKNMMVKYPGTSPVYLHVPVGEKVSKVCTMCCVNPDDTFVSAVKTIVGPDKIWVEGTAS